MKEKATNTIFWAFATAAAISGAATLAIQIGNMFYEHDGLAKIGSALAVTSVLCSFVATIIAMIILAKNEEGCSNGDEDDKHTKGVTEQIKALTELTEQFNALLELLSGDVPPKPAEPIRISAYRPDELHRRRPDDSNSAPKMDVSPRYPDPMKELLSKIDSGEL